MKFGQNSHPCTEQLLPSASNMGVAEHKQCLNLRSWRYTSTCQLWVATPKPSKAGKQGKLKVLLLKDIDAACRSHVKTLALGSSMPLLHKAALIQHIPKKKCWAEAIKRISCEPSCALFEPSEWLNVELPQSHLQESGPR